MIYLDNNSTTPLDPRILNAMIADWQGAFGNPSSIHSFGQEVRNRLTKARRSIASYLQVKPNEIIFTSSGTESSNMVIKGIFEEKPSGHIITSTVEHSCVYSTIRYLERLGCSVTYLSPGLDGAVTAEDVQNAIRSDTRLIALMAVNNETGVKTDFEKIAQIAFEKGIPFFVDGVALLGKEPFYLPKGVSAMSFSAHKLHGPKGIGACYIKSQLKLNPLLLGGGQEYERRGGTENIFGIIGFAEAFHILENELLESSRRMAVLRDRLEKGIQSYLPDVIVNGIGPRVVNTSNLSFLGVDGESLLMNLDLSGVAVSHGSACSSGAIEPSRILLNMGISPDRAKRAIRFSLSRFTTQEEIDRTIEIVVDLVKKMRSIPRLLA